MSVRLSRRRLLSLVGSGVVAAACGPAPTGAPAPAKVNAPTSAAPAASHGVTVESYASALDAAREALYKKAIAEEGGIVNVWGFVEAPPERVIHFQERWPGMNVSARGLGAGFAAAIIQANQAGQPNSDVSGGSITQWIALWERGLLDQTIDWSALGVPIEFLDPSLPGLFTDGHQHYGIWFNNKVYAKAEMPTQTQQFADPKWKSKLVASPLYFAGGLSFYGLKYGEQAAVDLARRLKENDTLISTGYLDLVLSGERPVIFRDAGVLDPYTKGAPVDFTFDDAIGIWHTWGGVINSSPHPSGAKLWLLSSVAPDWIQAQFDDPGRYGGLPTLPFKHPAVVRSPIAKALLEADAKGQTIWMTLENVKERIRLTDVISKSVLGG